MGAAVCIALQTEVKFSARTALVRFHKYAPYYGVVLTTAMHRPTNCQDVSGGVSITTDGIFKVQVVRVCALD